MKERGTYFTKLFEAIKFRDGGAGLRKALNESPSEDDIRAAIPNYHDSPDVVDEHNQFWAVCNACGWQASANESNRGVDLETVTEGDGSCEEKRESRKPKKNRRLNESFGNINTFVQAYIECALWSSTDESTESGGEPMDKNYGPEDIDSSTVSQMKKDCEDFVRDNEEDLEKSKLTASRAGHDFWLNRNGHGSGFWDEGNDPVFRKLSDASKVYGTFDLYVGDDGKIYGG